MKKIVNFSGGKSSGLMVDLILKENDKNDLIFIFSNTSKETPETYDFIKKCNEFYKMNLIVLEHKKGSFHETDIDNCKKNGEIFEQVIKEKKIIPNVAWRYCTDLMKITPTRRYLKSKGIKNYINFLGIRFDEPQRYSRIISRNNEKIYNDMPLYYAKKTKNDVNIFWENMPFNLGHDSLFGNCDLCFLKGKRKLIQILKRDNSKANWWIEQEKFVGNTFIKDISYKDLLNIAKQPEFEFEYFENENEIICNCNLDD